MKTVFTSPSDVIHLFAQRSQDNAKCGSTFFSGDKIYSYGYHYLLGEFVTNPEGQTAIIINNDGYSSTTSKHISLLISATRQYKQFFTSNIDLKNVFYSIESNVKKLQSARKKELYINPSNDLFNALNEYILWSGKKHLQKDETYKKIVALMSTVNGGDYAAYLKKEDARIKREAKKAEKLRAEKIKNDLIKFENYEIERFYNSECMEDYLRLSKDGLHVETSQSIRVSIKEAKILYKLIVDKKDIAGFQISNYTVVSINGVLKIGCHRINIESMHKIGKQLLTLNGGE